MNNTTLLLVVVLGAAAVFYLKNKSSNRREEVYRASSPTPIKETPKESNLNELTAKFKSDYFNQRLSEFANETGIEKDTISEIYPNFTYTNSMAYIKWTEFKGDTKELESALTGYSNNANFEIRTRYEYMLKERFDAEISALKTKLKETK